MLNVSMISVDYEEIIMFVPAPCYHGTWDDTRGVRRCFPQALPSACWVVGGDTGVKSPAHNRLNSDHQCIHIIPSKRKNKDDHWCGWLPARFRAPDNFLV